MHHVDSSPGLDYGTNWPTRSCGSISRRRLPSPVPPERAPARIVGVEACDFFHNPVRAGLHLFSLVENRQKTRQAPPFSRPPPARTAQTMCRAAGFASCEPSTKDLPVHPQFIHYHIRMTGYDLDLPASP